MNVFKTHIQQVNLPLEDFESVYTVPCAVPFKIIAATEKGLLFHHFSI